MENSTRESPKMMEFEFPEFEIPFDGKENSWPKWSRAFLEQAETEGTVIEGCDDGHVCRGGPLELPGKEG